MSPGLYAGAWRRVLCFSAASAPWLAAISVLATPESFLDRRRLVGGPERFLALLILRRPPLRRLPTSQTTVSPIPAPPKSPALPPRSSGLRRSITVMPISMRGTLRAAKCGGETATVDRLASLLHGLLSLIQHVEMRLAELFDCMYEAAGREPVKHRAEPGELTCGERRLAYVHRSARQVRRWNRSACGGRIGLGGDERFLAGRCAREARDPEPSAKEYVLGRRQLLDESLGPRPGDAQRFGNPHDVIGASRGGHGSCRLSHRATAPGRSSRASRGQRGGGDVRRKGSPAVSLRAGGQWPADPFQGGL